ncbi:hypothetical protein [Microvirga calopogonii]|uniref:hypothetical protein n=1 Tax=Microvirga calopogonii TaxID=2078013 RepID=UPI0013B43738|nr:hypothetical protein [Microvirga calopogonii]
MKDPVEPGKSIVWIVGINLMDGGLPCSKECFRAKVRGGRRKMMKFGNYATCLVTGSLDLIGLVTALAERQILRGGSNYGVVVFGRAGWLVLFSG